MIKKILERYKIDIFGITNQIDFSYLKNIYDLKNEKHYFASFDEKDFTKRSNLNSVFPNVKSIISMAFPYDTGEVFPYLDYTISKYAVRKDYHHIVKNILKNIVNDLKLKFPNNKFEIYVDSNPLFEKEIAKLCGIGDYGQNTLLYTAKYGSFVFLGEILSDLLIPEIKYSHFKSICDSCGLCSKLCPNNALKDNTLDSANCISFFTCSKSEISFSDIKNSLWGCDICQDICPMNKNRTFSNIEEFKIIKETFLELHEIINLSNKKLQDTFRFSAIAWTGAFPLKRNALILMAYSKNKKYIPYLENFISNSDNEKLNKYAKKALALLK